MFDWCYTGDHTGCPVKYQRFYTGQIKQGRKRVDGIIMLDEWRECDCKCHKAKKKIETKRAKKEYL